MPDLAAPSSRDSFAMDVAKTYEQCLPILERMAAKLCLKYSFSREDVEDFTQQVSLKVFANDYAVLRQYEGRSKLTTYLATVVASALKDFVNSRWGKWRASAPAVALGPVAVELEQLLVRDRMTFDEACHLLRIDRKVPLTERELEELAAQLPPRARWPGNRLESGGDAAGRAAAELSSPADPAAGAPESAEELLLRRERAPRIQKARAALREAIARQPSEDRLIVKLKFVDGFKLADVARITHTDQKRLYTRFTTILKRLQQELQSLGIQAEDIRDILQDADF